MAIVLGTLHNTSTAVDTDFFSSPFTYTAPTNVRPAPMKKLIIQIAGATGGSNLRALVSDGSTTETVILGTLTTAQVLYTFTMLWRSGDSVDFQYLLIDLGKLENNCSLPRKKVKQSASPMNSNKKITLSSLHDARDQERISKRSYYLKEYAFQNKSGNLISSPL